MGGLIKLIKNFFSSIFSFLGGLVGGKKSIEGSAPKPRKSSGYFLEWDGAEAAKKPVVSTPEVAASPRSVTVTSDATQTSKPSSKRSEQLAAAAASNGATTVQKSVEKAPAAVIVASKPEATVEFATKYLVPTSNSSRRRPGANMNSYLDMARGMKSN